MDQPPPARFVKKLLDDPTETLREVDELLVFHRETPSAYFDVFYRVAAIAHVYLSNRMEGTLPDNVDENETFVLLGSIFDEEVVPEGQWGADGDGLRVQMAHHMSALKFLLALEGPPLTMQQVMHAHRLLMSGARGVHAGAFRTTEAFGKRTYDNHVYSAPDTVERQLASALTRFNASAAGCTADTISAATRLFYDVITTHPFEDGNGRLCRLLLAAALKRGGIPFPINLSSGHRKAQALAIYKAQDNTHFSLDANLVELRTLVLKSIHVRLVNYVNNLRARLEVGA